LTTVTSEDKVDHFETQRIQIFAVYLHLCLPCVFKCVSLIQRTLALESCPPSWATITCCEPHKHTQCLPVFSVEITYISAVAMDSMRQPRLCKELKFLKDFRQAMIPLLIAN